MTTFSAHPLGPLMIDIAGHTLTALDVERLTHPLVGGVILFTRNYRDRQQLTKLCAEIHALRIPQLLIAIDHEGGRVQRCRDDFSPIPAMRKLGAVWDTDAAGACEAARTIGYLLAAELRQCGVDFSFTPVLDLDWGRSGVIGDRAFHRDPKAVIALAGALITGLQSAGMRCCGKHFPGHGWVAADSHVAIPVDERSLSDMSDDLMPYRHLTLDAVMPAHVIYPQVDSRPAGFSPVWINKLRNEFSFDGVIFSDDLSMEGASVAGNIVSRANAAWTAGCDVLLVCNAPDDVSILLETWQPVPAPNIRPLTRLVPDESWQQDKNCHALGIAAIEQLAG
ncbi:MAG TPA: beta-N-acetylhexosaminidase [Rugosibacter sp.]